MSIFSRCSLLPWHYVTSLTFSATETKKGLQKGINKTYNTEPFDVKAPSLELWENKEYRFIATAPRSTLN